MAHGSVDRGREEKTHADFFDGTSCGFRREIHANAEGFEHFSGSAMRADRAIAVFRDAHSRARHYESGRGRDIERAASVAAGAAGIDQRLIGWKIAAVRENWRGVTAHYRGEADQLVHGLAFHAQ